MASALAAGWYADPADSSRYRYWTGDQWTTHVRDRGAVDIAAAAAARPLPDFDAAEVAAAEPEAKPRRRRLPILAVLALLALVATAGVVTFGGSGRSPGGSTLTGEVRVAIDQAKGGGGPGGFVADGTRCGIGRPPGIGAGTEVTVSNARGEMLGHTELHAGQVDRTLNSTTCVFAYEIPAVPDADVYALRVTGLPATRRTSTQLEASSWRADLRVG